MLFVSILTFNLTDRCQRINNMIRNIELAIHEACVFVITMTETSDCKCYSSNVIYSNTTGFHPKQRFWYEFVRPNAPIGKNDAIWLLDEDLYMEFNRLSTFWSIWKENRPMLAQPLIQPDTQFMKFLNYNSWSAFQPIPKQIATSYVEIQAPIFRADFFSWFTTHVLSNHWKYQDTYHTTWGTDQLWCVAATKYRTILNESDTNIPCAIISVPIFHNDTNTIKEKNSAKWQIRGHKSTEWASKKYASWIGVKSFESRIIKCKTKACLSQIQKRMIANNNISAKIID